MTALAHVEPYLWIGNARGLRRFRLPAGPVEWIGGELPALGRQVSALAADGAGRLLVATETGVSALTDAGEARPRHERLAPLAGVTHLLSVGGGPGGKIFAGTSQGLFVVQPGTGAVAVSGAAGAAVTSLDAAIDGKTAWVGLRGRGLLHVEDKSVTAAYGPGSGVDFADSIGVAALPNGTQVALGRNAAGATRVLQLRADGPELLVPQRDFPVFAVVATAEGPLLLAGATSAPRAYRLVLAARGETVEGGVRFGPARTSLDGPRLTARPQARQLPAQVSVAIAVFTDVQGEALFVGTGSAGVARLAAGSGASGVTEYLPVGELALGARRLSVACLERDRCVFSTGAGPGWIWDGSDRTAKAIPEGAIGNELMALAGDGAGTVYFVTGGTGKTLSVARLSGDGGQWQHVLDVPVEGDGRPVAGFATLSPKGDLWMAVRDRVASGQEFGRGVIEVSLPAGRAIHHRVYTAKEKAPAEAIALTGDVAALRFQAGQGGAPDAIWFCTASGVMRFGGGNLERWGENEGLESEHCNDVLPAADGTVWMATDAGVVRFDGKQWLPVTSKAAARAGAGAPVPWPVDREGENLVARSLVASGQDVWAGTPQGLWPLTRVAPPLGRANGLFDDDVADAVADRFGRLWVLGHIGLTVRPAL